MSYARTCPFTRSGAVRSKAAFHVKKSLMGCSMCKVLMPYSLCIASGAKNPVNAHTGHAKIPG